MSIIEKDNGFHSMKKFCLTFLTCIVLIASGNGNAWCEEGHSSLIVLMCLYHSSVQAASLACTAKL